MGASSPIPAAASLVAQAMQPALRVSLLGSESDNVFTDGGRELFDCAAQGRIDTFFLSGVQIDGQANINLVGVGEYPQLKRRYAGSFGSAFLYHHIPNVILFCWAHSARTLVENVDFISAAGPRHDGIWRRGGPSLLLTDRCEFRWNATPRSASNGITTSDATHDCQPDRITPEPAGEFVLESLHPGESIEAVVEQTGFQFSVSSNSRLDEGVQHKVPSKVSDDTDDFAPDRIEELLRSSVLPSLEQTYPQFVKRFYA